MYHYLPHSAWAAVRLAEGAVELGRMMEHRYTSQPNLGHDQLPNPVVNIGRNGTVVIQYGIQSSAKIFSPGCVRTPLAKGARHAT